MAHLKWNNRFSDKERDRRWQLMRDYMKSKGLDALLVLGAGLAYMQDDLSQVEDGNGSRLQTLDSYLSGWADRCTVIFPLKGEPTLLGVPLHTVMLWTKETPKDELPWMEDIRIRAQAEDIVAVLKEKGLEQGRVSVGISKTAAGGNRGSWCGYAKRDQVAKLLPECNFEDPGDDLLKLMLAKSEEELAMFRQCAYAMEQAMIAMAKTVRVGATELDVHLAMTKALYENGAIPGNLYLTSGKATVGMAGRLWDLCVGSPRVFEPGDVVNTGCDFAYVGGIESQGQCTVAIPPVSQENAECARISREMYKEGLRVLRPGIPFKEVAEAMAAPLDKAGAWTTNPTIHGFNPYFFSAFGSEASERRQEEFYKEYYQRFGVQTSGSPGGVDSRADVLLMPGMVFQFEPAAGIGRHRVNVGGNVIVTETGNEPLNEIGTQMRIAGEV